MPPPVLDESGGAVDDGGGRQRCSCLPFCFWGASLMPKNKSAGAPAKRRRRRRRRRFRLRLSWLAWPWFFSSRKGGKRKGAAGDGRDDDKGKKKRASGRRLLLLLTTSLQPKKALESVVSGDSALLQAKAGSLGDAKKRSNRKPRPTVADDGPSGSRQPQASTTASTTRWSTAPARPRADTSHPSPTPTDGRIWRAPSRRRHSFQYQPDSITGRPGGAGVGGMWTAATTLGVVVLFGRVTAVVLLCSCLYGARFVRAWMGGAGAKHGKSSGVAGGSRRFGDPVGVAAEKAVAAEQCATEECKKKVVMAGLLDRDRAGKTPASSRFGRRPQADVSCK